MTGTSNSFLTNALDVAWRRRGLIACVAGALVLYIYWVWGLSTNPPGFYLDESGGAYNAYLIATTGKSEFGLWFPLYPQFYTESFVQYSNPVHIYLMSVMYLIVPPSNLSARVCMATMTFIAVILLGVLATRISGRKSIGAIVTLTAAATPWIFEPSRLVLEAAVYPLALALLLVFVYNAVQREKWKLSDNVLIGLALAMGTYTYTIGRLLGPLLALGLLIFVRNWKTLFSVIRTWIVYALTMVPFLVVYFGGDTVTRRFHTVTWVDMSQPWSVFFGQLYDAYSEDISLRFLLDQGDPLVRHHIPGMGGLLAATFGLAMAGIVIVLIRHRRERWWWFIIYGLLIGILPGALTVQRFHSLRTIAFPVFLLVLTVPALMWLLGESRSARRASQSFAEWLDDLPGRFIGFVVEWRRRIFNRRLLGKILVAIILVLTLNQAYDFQVRFREIGPTRGQAYDQAYLPILEAALASPLRPIYLQDGFWGPAYIHALWYAAVLGVDRSNFVHLAEGELPPDGSLVLSSNNSCDRCEVVMRAGSYLLYKTTGREGVIEPPPPPAQPGEASPKAVPAEKLLKPQVIRPDASKPHGIVADAAGNIYITDAGNSRVLKLSPTGELLAIIGQNGEGGLIEPTGIALDAAGDIYVTDVTTKKVVKFKANGTFEREWNLGAGFTNLRDISLGSDKQLYITDRGRAKIVRLDPETGEKTEWGENGTGDGQFDTVNGIAISGNTIFVADATNDRVEAFDLAGNFLRQWPVPQWGHYLWHRPDIAVDQKSNIVYVTSGWSHEVLVFDTEGNFIKPLMVEEPAKYNNPSSIFLSDTKRGKFLYVLNTGADVVDTGPPSIFVFDLGSEKK